MKKVILVLSFFISFLFSEEIVITSIDQVKKEYRILPYPFLVLSTDEELKKPLAAFSCKGNKVYSIAAQLVGFEPDDTPIVIKVNPKDRLISLKELAKDGSEEAKRLANLGCEDFRIAWAFISSFDPELKKQKVILNSPKRLRDQGAIK